MREVVAPRFAWLIFCLMTCNIVLGCVPKEKIIIEYRSLLHEKGGYRFDYSSKQFQAYGGDLGFKFSTCDVGRKYKCILSKGINLAVPIVKGELPEEWVFNKFKYQIIDHTNIEISRKEYQFSIVKIMSEDRTDENRQDFYNSYEREILELEEDKLSLDLTEKDVEDINNYIQKLRCSQKNLGSQPPTRVFLYNKKFGIYLFAIMPIVFVEDCHFFNNNLAHIYILAGKKGLLSQ